MTARDKLIRDMLRAFWQLRCSRYARVDARILHARFLRQAKKLGIKPKGEHD